MRAQRLGWAPYALLLPTLAFLAVFFAVPMVRAFGLAFQDAEGSWSLASWRTMFDDAQFREALVTTLLLIVVIIPVQFALALAMALVVNAKLKASGLWLYVYAIPLGISDLAAGIIWYGIFIQAGWLNAVLEGLGLLDRPFIFLNPQSQGWLIFAVVLAEAWRATSIIMIILVAGLQSIPREYLEAAEVYGATPWQRIRHVTLPLLRPSLQVALIIRTILAFQAFAVVIALAAYNLPVLAGETYRWYGDLRNPNVAAAYALVIMLFSLLNTGIYLRALRTRDEQVGMT
jgi:multiple sugar transport system permease protein